MKRNVLVALALIFTLVVSACSSSSGKESSSSPATTSNNTGSPAGSGETIKIGAVFAISGPASAIGKPMADAAAFFSKQVKDKGGKIGGKNVEVIVKDHETNDTNAVSLAKKLIADDKVVALVGATQVSTSIAVAQVAKEYKVPFLAPGPVNNRGEYTFQINPDDNVILEKVAKYLNKHNLKNVAWMNARDAFGQGAKPLFEKQAEKNGLKIVAQEDFDGAATDMTVQLTKIKAKNPDAIVVWSRQPAASIVAKNYKQLGMKAPMIQSHAVGNDSFLNVMGKDGEGIMVIGSKITVLDQLPAAEQEIYKKFAADFKKQFGYTADLFSTNTYDAFQIMAKAIEAGKTTPSAINEWLESGGLGEFTSVSGKMTLSKGKRIAPDASGLAIMEIHTEGSKTAYRFVD